MRRPHLLPLALAALAAAPLSADGCNDLFQQGALTQAEDCLQAQARARPEQARAWYRLGLARAARGHYREAVDAQRLAVGHAPGLGQAYCALALDLRECDQSVEGLTAAGEAVRLLPGYAGAWNLLGVLQRDNGHPAEAMAAYDRALALRPDYVEAWWNLGDLDEHSGRIQDARQAYSQALALKPAYADARLYRGELALAHGPLEQAEGDFQALTAGGELQPEGWWGLERVAKAQGRKARANECRQRYKAAVRERDHRLDRRRRDGHEELQPYEPGLPLPALPQEP